MSTLTSKPAVSWPHDFAERSAARIPLKFLPLAVVRMAAAVARAYRIRRDTRQVMALNDHMLDDIGVGRSEIGGAARRGRDLL